MNTELSLYNQMQINIIDVLEEFQDSTNRKYCLELSMKATLISPTIEVSIVDREALWEYYEQLG